jgi:hypothetical protein
MLPSRHARAEMAAELAREELQAERHDLTDDVKFEVASN